VLNLCANNYLGFANHTQLKDAAKAAIDKFGVGPAAVRTIAGTQSLHLELEAKLAAFKHVEDAITFQSGFIANQAVIPTITGAEDVIFSDELNHASIIDGIRLSKAKVVRYAHNSAADLDAKLKAEPNARRKLIITDGVFSMDGDIAPLDEIVYVAERHDALTMVDDAHGEGVLGKAAAAPQIISNCTIKSTSKWVRCRKRSASWAATSPERKKSSTACANERGRFFFQARDSRRRRCLYRRSRYSHDVRRAG